MQNKDYRLDIQGLRALAVLLVFFAHANWYPFSGGFIGVDIFFVISGYVITQLLIKSHNRNGTIIFHDFYARRLLRLLPALILMTLLTCVVALVFLTPVEQLIQYDSALSAVLWVSNIFFIDSNLNYFAPSASQNLYLHTWSLGVEEQFYLIWPIIMLLGLKFFSIAKNKLLGLFVFLLSIIILSIITHVYFTIYSNIFSFFLMPTRAWQFGLGALIAVLHSSKIKIFANQKPAFLLELGMVLGLTMIFFSAILFGHYTPYPNWQVLIPSLGVALVILPKYNPKQSFIGIILTTKPLVFIGNISYSFYLWHWPILLLCKKLVHYFPFANTAFALLLTMVMSLISYYFVEQPIRKNKRLLSHPKFAIILLLGIMTIAIISIFVLKSYSENLKQDKKQQLYNSARYQLPVVYQLGCDDWYKSAKIVKCEFGDESSLQKVVVFGDSILIQWFPAILNYYEKINWHVIVFIKNGCPIINRPFFYYRIMSVYNVCDSWKETAIKEIQLINPDVVIMGNSTGYPFSKKQWQTGTIDIIERLLPYTNEIKLFAGTPELGIDGPLCLARRDWITKSFPSFSKSSCSNKLVPHDSWKWQDELSQKYSKVQFIELSKLVCPNNNCLAITDSLLVYRDSIHLTIKFVLSLQSFINSELSIKL